MFDNYSSAVNAGLGILLMISPSFFADHGISVAEVKKMYSEAQVRAEYIVATGDTSELAEIDAALAEVAGYQKQMQSAAPILKAVQKKMLPGVDLESLAYENIDTGVSIDADAAAALEESLN